MGNDLTVDDVAAELKLHPETIRRLLQRGAIPGYKAGLRQWRVTRNALDAFKLSGGVRPKGRPRRASGETKDVHE